MQEIRDYDGNQQETSPTVVEREPGLESEYRQTLRALNHTGVLSILPLSEKLGVIGVDGHEYPIPTVDEVQEVIDRSRKLVEAKKAQGFTKLQLTPLAAPLPTLLTRVEQELVRHAKEGKVFQSKRNPSDSDVVAQIDTANPTWVWSAVRTAITSDGISYFPKVFGNNHGGKTKLEISGNPKICAVPGWSVGLIEDRSTLPQAGQGQTLGGRKQLENNQSPNDYLKALQASSYRGESGWTYEDFLTNFLLTLDIENRVSHEWDQASALWLLGSYLPSPGSVGGGDWYRDDSQLSVAGYVPDDSDGYWGVRSTVRLSV